MSEGNKTKICQWARCSKDSDVIYYGLGLCEKHWEAICEMSIEEAHKKLDIKAQENK